MDSTSDSNIQDEHANVDHALNVEGVLLNEINNPSTVENAEQNVNNINIAETDNFITINNNQSSNSKRFFINGITNERPIIKLKSITDIFLNVFGKTGNDDQIYFNSNNDNYIGIHTHDINLSLFMHDGLDVLFSDPDIYFEMNFTVFSSSEIIIESNYLINYLN